MPQVIGHRKPPPDSLVIADVGNIFKVPFTVSPIEPPDDFHDAPPLRVIPLFDHPDCPVSHGKEYRRKAKDSKQDGPARPQDGFYGEPIHCSPP